MLFLSILIPARNEESCIEHTIQSIISHLEQHNIPHEILVVNDNSDDQTENVLKNVCSQNCMVRYLNNHNPKGYGFAVRCGLENFHGDAVAIVMADGSDDPKNIMDYYYKIQEGYDCVFGSRFVKGGTAVGYPFSKLILNRLYNYFIQVTFGLRFNDITNAFKIYRREVINGIYPLKSDHFNLTVEMPLKAIIRGYSYTTVPITWRNRSEGNSKFKLRELGTRYLFIFFHLLIEKLSSYSKHQKKT